MRLLFVAGLCLSSLVANPAAAQVQQNDPNAANRSLETRGEIRSLQQEQTTRTDMLRMDLQRNQAATPAPNTGPNAIGPIGGGTGVGR
ncbi:MAG: hypothetical protein INR70_38800 [Parafilimonas terrae]|jgi:hypothetical protein|nr:hypothetical protein [Parafilimonas terrae]